jgi:cobalt/nickel transport system permease protein
LAWRGRGCCAAARRCEGVHHVVLDRWSRLASPLHRWDARLKFLALLIFLVTLGLQRSPARALVLAAPLLATLAISGLPAWPVLVRAAFVLPFSATFAGLAWLMGDGQRAGLLLEKSYLSALAVVLVVGSTPMPSLLAAFEWLGIPRALVLTIQMVYRYLFVIFEKAQHMRQAVLCRTGTQPQRRLLLRSGAGLMAVLFGGAHEHAAGVHHAMLARGFAGRLPLLQPAKFRPVDWALLALAVTLTIGLPAVA